MTDQDISSEEVGLACKAIGKGTSIDGISPEIISILPDSLKSVITTLFNKTFNGPYPKPWTNQMLIPIPKTGHSSKVPKLRGIAIGPVLSRMYDIVLNNRFCNWYKPNPQQAGFRKGQGCIVHIFSLLLQIDLSKHLNRDLFVALFDYEKAFDYVNRPTLIQDLVKHGIGSRFTKAICNMYTTTKYIPKISQSRLGEEISTNYGVTQGRCSSANLFSFYVHDLYKEANNINMIEFMDRYDLFQLADDIAVTAEFLDTLKSKIQVILKYSEKKYLGINVSKTKYLHISESPVTTPLQFESCVINSIEKNTCHSWLGFQLRHTNNVTKLIDANISNKMFNIAKYFAWLEINECTPFCIKLSVLYGCVFASLLFSVEAWGDTKTFMERVLQIERKLLKKCLGVKSGTNNDLIYVEIYRADIIAHIKDRQFKFFKNISQLSIDDSIVKGVMHTYDRLTTTKENSITKYYTGLSGKEKELNVRKRLNRVNSSTKSSDVRYRTIIGTSFNKVLYASELNDEDRKIITRWRLSNHNLKIEKGRYTTPFTPRQDRLCVVCDELEDEEHALFVCKIHANDRVNFKSLLNRSDVHSLLNPKSLGDASEIACFLRRIENNLNLLYHYKLP